MPRYEVEVEFTSKRTITVYALNEEQAEEHACELVEKWENIMEVTETNCIGEAK